MALGPVREPDTIRRIRTRLMWARELRGVSQRDMAKATGLDQGNVSKIESGYTRNPTLGNVAAMAQVLGAHLELVQEHQLPLLELDRAEVAMVTRVIREVMAKHPDPAHASPVLRSCARKLSGWDE